MRDDNSASAASGNSVKLTGKVYGIMAVTIILTFAALMTGYQLLFPPQSLFA
jgi:hypothetical protein